MGVAAALLTGMGVSTATAGPGPHAWSTYYDNEFGSRGKCRARGNWMVGAPPWGAPGIVGMDKYRCFRYDGDQKWSMNVRWYGRWAT